MRAETTTKAKSWQVVSGSSYCQIVDGGRCVTDGSGYYGAKETCRVLALRPLVVYTKQYVVESKYDYLTVNGVQYKSSGSGPNGVKMSKGAALLWRSDEDTQSSGWKVCAQDTMTTTGISHTLHTQTLSKTHLTSPLLAAPHLTSPNLTPQSLNDYGKNVTIAHACTQRRQLKQQPPTVSQPRP